jgi:hypothetical protein
MVWDREFGTNIFKSGFWSAKIITVPDLGIEFRTSLRRIYYRYQYLRMRIGTTYCILLILYGTGNFQPLRQYLFCVGFWHWRNWEQCLTRLPIIWISHRENLSFMRIQASCFYIFKCFVLHSNINLYKFWPLSISSHSSIINTGYCALVSFLSFKSKLRIL